jgi:MFS family permease
MTAAGATSTVLDTATGRALRSVFVVFTVPGLVIASLLSRVPQLRDLLHLDPGELGVVLLMTAIGSLLALPASGTVVHRFGPRRTVAIMSVVSLTGLGVVAIGSEISSAVVGAGLFLFGFGAGQWSP